MKCKFWVPWSEWWMFQECKLYVCEGLCVHTDWALYEVWEKRSEALMQVRDLTNLNSVRICCSTQGVRLECAPSFLVTHVPNEKPPQVWFSNYVLHLLVDYGFLDNFVIYGLVSCPYLEDWNGYLGIPLWLICLYFGWWFTNHLIVASTLIVKIMIMTYG
jgi:hypothetical protein